MDFNQLMARIKELDQPVPETAVAETPVVTDECGEMPPAPMGMPPKEDAPPPSMSINLNAQGLDNIEELMKLIKAVNPDAEMPAIAPTAGPNIEIEPMDKPAGDMPKLGGLGDLDKGPLKMLPDLDKDEGPEDKGPVDIDSMDDKEEKEEFANEPEEEYKDADYMLNQLAGGMNRPKKMFAKSQDGDNAMSVESTDLRSQIRAELLRRLEEAKGAK